MGDRGLGPGSGKPSLVFTFLSRNEEGTQIYARESGLYRLDPHTLSVTLL